MRALFATITQQTFGRLDLLFNATKHGITGLTRSTSLGGRQDNIACGQIDIGNAATEMSAPMQTGVLQVLCHLGLGTG